MPVKKRKKSTPKKRIAKRKIVKKKILKKKAIRRTQPKKKAAKKPKKKSNKKVVGAITHYFPHVRAAVVKVKIPLKVGDSIKIKGHTTDFTQNVESMQIDRTAIESAKKGQEIGLLVNSRVRRHDIIYKL